MPKNAYLHADDLPEDLQLDLLVDGELSEPRRRQLLERMDDQPTQWRGLAIRFLQQQTEKQSIKALMAGGKVVPVEIASPGRRPAILGRVGWQRMSAVAAALAIAAGSALVTLWAVHPASPPGSGGTDIASGGAAEFPATLPGDMLGSHDVNIHVPLVPVREDAALLPVVAREANRPAKTTYILQPDGKGGVIYIPVSMSKSPVY